ncbi:S8 family serine peptidase [Patescibacteria group bacterium]
MKKLHISHNAFVLITSVFILLSIPLTVFLAQQKHELRSKASEGNLSEIGEDSIREPEYKKGEVIIKLKENTLALNVKREKEIQGVSIDEAEIALEDLDEASIPESIRNLNDKYKVTIVEKIFKGAGTPREELNELNEKFSTEIREGTRTINEQKFLKNDLSKYYVLKFTEDVPVKEIVGSLFNKEGIEYAELNYLVKINDAILPTDTFFNDQWALNNTGQTGGLIDADIDLPEAWGITTGLSSVIIAVTDTGIDYTHPELGGCMGEGCKVVGGYDFYNLDSNPMDDNSHGTHVAGIAAGIASNQKGIVGVCPNCKLLAAKFLNAGGSGYIDDGMEAIQYSVNNGARVINASWGGGGYSQSAQDILDWTAASGVVFVAAAGNDNRPSPAYPAAYRNVLSIAATTKNDTKTSYSNYGVGWVDLSAPGGEVSGTGCRYPLNDSILSTATGGTIWNTYGEECGILEGQDKYIPLAGTSMAAPHVSGVAGLLFSYHPDWSAFFVAGQIKYTTDDIDGLNPTYEGLLGRGRLNAFGALSNDTPRPGIEYINLPPDMFHPGQQTSFDIQLINEWGPAFNVNANLTSGDPNVAVLQGNASYGDMATGEIKPGNAKYVVNLSSSTPWGYNKYIDLELGLNYKDSEGSSFSETRIVRVDVSSVPICSFVSKWDSVGSGDGQFEYPIDVVVDKLHGNYVYVLDTYLARVQKFTSDGQFITKWGTEGLGDGLFDNPMGISVDSEGNVYVVDYGNSRVQKFTSDGQFITKWGTEGSGDGQFTYPTGIAIDSLDIVYVTDGTTFPPPWWYTGGTKISKIHFGWWVFRKIWRWCFGDSYWNICG